MSAFIKKYLQVVLGSMLLLVSLVDAQVVINEPKNGSIVAFKNQFVAGQAPAGLPIQLFVNGNPVDSAIVRPDGVFEFIGVSTPEGPVTYTVLLYMKDGKIIKTERRIHRIGSPDSLAIELPSENLSADGSKINIKARVYDAWGKQIPNGYFVTLFVDSTITDAFDADPHTPGLQVRINNGVAEFTMRSPNQAGLSTLAFNIDKANTKKEIEFSTPIAPLMIVGSADASATSLTTSGDLNQLINKDKINKGIHTDGRLAFYGRGSVWGNYLLTASYDNKRHQQDRLFRDLDPDVLYSIYGDNSSVDYTAQTSNPFFVKLEKNLSYIMFGDFNTQFGQNELARYDRTFTGVSGRYAAKTDKVDAFATVTDRKVVQDEIRGQGISGFYFLGSNNVVPGSEKVRVETRDKRHNEVILSRIEKSRFGDYEIDYTQGTLFFKQPIASIDDAGNPVYIVVSYEAQGGFATSYVAGIQGEKEILTGLKVGATAVTEERKPTNYTLFGFNTKYSITNVFSTSAEVARGADVSNNGTAWKIEVAGSPIERMQLKSYFRKVENGFVNQTAGAGGSSEIGSTKYGVGGSYDGLWETKVSTDYYRTEQTSGNTNVFVNSITGGVERKIANFATLALRAENLEYESARTDTSLTEKRRSTLLNAKTTVRASNRLNFTGEYEQSLSNSSKEEVKPSSAAFGAEYRVFDNMTLNVQQRIYMNHGNQTTFGVGSDLGYGTTVTGRYELGNGISGRRNQASIGLKNTTKISQELTSNLQFERTRALDRNVAEAKTNDNDAVSLGLEYLPKKSYKATVKGEWSKNTQSIRRALTFGGDLRLASDFTLIDKMTYFEEDRSKGLTASNTFADGNLSANQAGTELSNGLLKKFDNAIGLAYRPVDFDWLNAIGKFEKKIELNGVVAPQSSYDVNIVSVHTFIEPVIGLEIGTKYAMKYATEESYGLKASTITDFYLIRAEYDLRWNSFDVAGEYRILNSRIIGQSNSNSIKNGYSAEIGNVVFQNIHIGIGYNFVGTQERDLVGKDYWSAGPFVSIRAKFTEKILGYFNK